MALNASHFFEMAPELQMLILEELDLVDLMNVADTNKHFNHMALDIYRRKFQERLVKIEGRLAISNEVYVNENHISFSNPTTSSMFLRIFGHLIRKVWIFNMDMCAEDIELIAKNLNQFCSNTLLQLDIYNCPMNIWDSMPAPFKSMESVTFMNKLETTENQNFTEIFPKIRRLGIDFVNSHHEDTFNAHFTHLEHLAVGFVESQLPDDAFQHRDFQRICQMNPQIRTLSLQYTSHEPLKYASEHLKNLESLQVSWPTWNSLNPDDEIRFESVK